MVWTLDRNPLVQRENATNAGTGGVVAGAEPPVYGGVQCAIQSTGSDDG